MRVTGSDALALPLRVAALHSISNLTDLPGPTLGLLARHRTVLSTDTLLHALVFRVEGVSSLVVVPVVGAATVSHRHTGDPAQQEAFVTLAGFSTTPATGGMGG